ncbi:hypothetical protein BT69DRAFT_1283568 [Atractiella rhizophila]|nr:hypothetical protein BT69DRAFT_1283568 [Atractiella rhizophila]
MSSQPSAAELSHGEEEESEFEASMRRQMAQELEDDKKRSAGGRRRGRGRGRGRSKIADGSGKGKKNGRKKDDKQVVGVDDEGKEVLYRYKSGMRLPNYSREGICVFGRNSCTM